MASTNTNNTNNNNNNPLLLITGSYDRSLRVWTDNNPPRTLAFNTSQVNCMTISNEGRFVAVAGHCVIRVFELGSLQGPHVSNENAPAVPVVVQQQNQQQQQQPPQPPQPALVESNFTSLHFVMMNVNVPATTSSEQQQQQQQQQQQVLISTSEDGIVRIWEAKGQALTISQQSSASAVGCPLLCSCVTQNKLNLNQSTTTSTTSSTTTTTSNPLFLFAGSQAGILYGWNLSNNNNNLSNTPPAVRILVNRYPISAISCLQLPGNNNGMLVASNTQGVVMSFWYDTNAVQNGSLSLQSQQNNISRHKQQILARQEKQQQQQQQQGGTTQSVTNTETNNPLLNKTNNNNNNINNTNIFETASNVTKDQNQQNNTSSSSSSTTGQIFDGDAIPINQIAVPPSVFNWTSIFKAHNKYIVRNVFSPNCYSSSTAASVATSTADQNQQQQQQQQPFLLLATASADCTVKLWRVPLHPHFAAYNKSNNFITDDSILSVLSSSDDPNIGVLAGEQAIKRALLVGTGEAYYSSIFTSSTASVADGNNNNSNNINKNNSNNNNNNNNLSKAELESQQHQQQLLQQQLCFWRLECTIPHQRWVWDVAFSSNIMTKQYAISGSADDNLRQQSSTLDSSTTPTSATATIMNLYTASSDNSAWSWNVVFKNTNHLQQNQQQHQQQQVDQNNKSSTKSNNNNNNNSSGSSSYIPYLVSAPPSGSPAKTFQYTGHQKPVTCIVLQERM